MDFGEIAKGVGFDWQIALANLVNFLIIFWLLRKFAFGPIKKVIDERREKIDKGLVDAETARGQLLSAEQQSEEILKEARLGANEIMGEAKERSDDMIREAKKNAEESADEIILSAKKKASMEIEQAEKELEKKTADLIAAGVEKILSEEVDVEGDRARVKQSLGKI